MTSEMFATKLPLTSHQGNLCAEAAHPGSSALAALDLVELMIHGLLRNAPLALCRDPRMVPDGANVSLGQLLEDVQHLSIAAEALDPGHIFARSDVARGVSGARMLPFRLELCGEIARDANVIVTQSDLSGAGSPGLARRLKRSPKHNAPMSKWAGWLEKYYGITLPWPVPEDVSGNELNLQSLSKSVLSGTPERPFLDLLMSLLARGAKMKDVGGVSMTGPAAIALMVSVIRSTLSECRQTGPRSNNLPRPAVLSTLISLDACDEADAFPVNAVDIRLILSLLREYCPSVLNAVDAANRSRNGAGQALVSDEGTTQPGWSPVHLPLNYMLPRGADQTMRPLAEDSFVFASVASACATVIGTLFDPDELIGRQAVNCPDEAMSLKQGVAAMMAAVRAVHLTEGRFYPHEIDADLAAGASCAERVCARNSAGDVSKKQTGTLSNILQLAQA